MLCCGSVKRRRAAAAFVVCVFVTGEAALLGPAHVGLQVQLCGVEPSAALLEGRFLSWKCLFPEVASTPPMFLQRKRLHVQLMLSVYVHI